MEEFSAVERFQFQIHRCNYTLTVGTVLSRGSTNDKNNHVIIELAMCHKHETDRHTERQTDRLTD